MQTKVTFKLIKALQDAGHDDLVEELLEKHDPTAAVLTTLHGEGGVLSSYGAQPNMFHTILQPMTWPSRLPVRKTQYQDSIVEILTEQTDSTGDNADNYCDTAPVPGDLKRCRTKTQIADWFMQSKQNVVVGAGLLRDPAETERSIVNLRSLQSPFLPSILTEGGVNLRSPLAQSLLELTIALARSLAAVEVVGDHSTATASAERGWTTEPDGLALLIKDGHVDENGGLACAAADSLVVDWDSNGVDDTVNGLDIVSTITDMLYSRVALARKLGISAAWRFVGDERLFREVSFKVASTYANARYLDASSSVPVGRDMPTVEQRYQEMKRTNTIMIDGMPVEWIFTSGAEAAAGGLGYISDLFLECYMVNGAPNSWIEYYDMDNPYVQQWVGSAFNSTGRRTFNNGMYISALRSSGFCDEVLLASMPRFMHYARFLSARLDSVSYKTYLGYRSWLSTDSFAGGGESSFSF